MEKKKVKYPKNYIKSQKLKERIGLGTKLARSI